MRMPSKAPQIARNAPNFSTVEQRSFAIDGRRRIRSSGARSSFPSPPPTERPALPNPIRPPLPLAAATVRIRPEPLAVPPDTQTAIAAHWQAALSRNPRLWNGSAFLFDRIDLADSDASGDGDTGRTLLAEGARTDFATFLHWRATPPTERRLYHLFPVGAVVTADDKLIVGKMSAHTANPGMHYPPSGSLDISDLIVEADGSGHIDLDANIVREIREEIGLDAAAFTVEPGWILMSSGPMVRALIRILRSPKTAAALAGPIRRHVADDPHQELADIRFVDPDFRFAPGEAAPYVNELLAYLAKRG
jgi:8-oxo-dGTP pyrophosphatase MutT (NUDIX family)